MTGIKDEDKLILMHKLRNGGWTNLFELFENIVGGFRIYQVIEEHTLFDDVKHRFHNDLHDSFVYTIPTLLFKFLINKGVEHIVTPWSLLAIPYYIDWH